MSTASKVPVATCGLYAPAVVSDLSMHPLFPLLPPRNPRYGQPDDHHHSTACGQRRVQQTHFHLSFKLTLSPGPKGTPGIADGDVGRNSDHTENGTPSGAERTLEITADGPNLPPLSRGRQQGIPSACPWYPCAQQAPTDSFSC